MKLLLDTQMLVWVSSFSHLLPDKAASALLEHEAEIHFSVAGLWAVAIKFARGKENFQVDPRVLRPALLKAGYVELPITGLHTLWVTSLPPLHKDPFDRLLVAQAITDGLTLVTTDSVLASYPIPVLRV